MAAILADVDWNAVGAIGQWAGAIATTAAVVVALQQVAHTTAIRLKVTVGRGLYSHPSIAGTVGLVVVTVANVGLRRGTVTQVAIRLPNGESFIKLPAADDPLGSTPIPSMIEEGQVATVRYQTDELLACLQSMGCRGSVSLVAFATDVTGRSHESPFTLQLPF